MTGRRIMTTMWAGMGLAMATACAQPPGSGNEPASSMTTELAGPRWRLVELDGQPSIAGGGAREPHLIFSESDSVDRVGGATGCNSMGGTYEADGSRLRFSQLFSTKMACVEQDRMRQEARFVNALETADRYEISGDTLTLRAGDTVVAKFVKG